MTDKPKQYRYKGTITVHSFDDRTDCYNVNFGGKMRQVTRGEFERDYEPVEQAAQGWINVEKDYLEHLLNCLANQKFLHEMSHTVRDSKGVLMREDTQKLIDKAWVKGMDMLYLPKPPAREI